MTEFRKKKVSKDEFDAFIASYPRPLVREVFRMGEPERMCYYDGPNEVASYFLWGCDPNDIWANVPGDWRITVETPTSYAGSPVAEVYDAFGSRHGGGVEIRHLDGKLKHEAAGSD